jgi:hypothetical protein
MPANSTQAARIAKAACARWMKLGHGQSYPTQTNSLFGNA